MRHSILIISSFAVLTWTVSSYGQTWRDGYKAAEMSIIKYCSSRAVDLTSREQCIGNQKRALEILKKGRPRSVPEGVFELVRHGCEKDNPEDFVMRLGCEKEQVDAYNELKSSNPEGVMANDFIELRDKCTWQWPYDFKKRLECENEGIEKLRLKSPARAPRNNAGD